MSRTRISAFILMLCLPGLMLLTGPPANAEPELTVPITLVGDQPVSGRFALGYTNYYEKHQRCYGSPHPQCQLIGYRVGRGSVKTRLRTYQIEEGIKRFDYFLLDVDVVNANRSGSSKYGEGYVTIRTRKSKPVETYDSRSVSADDEGCTSVDVTMSTPWPWIQASTEVGSVEFCHEDASLRRSDGRFKAHRLQMIRNFTISRAVKVPAGQRPRFVVKLLLPIDDCTKVSSSGTWCTAYDNIWHSDVYRVGTSG